MKIKITESQYTNLLREQSKGENYMFFSNLKQMRRQLDIMINKFDSNMVNVILNNGHDWADDHITEAKVNIDQVSDFFMNKVEGEDERLLITCEPIASAVPVIGGQSSENLIHI